MIDFSDLLKFDPELADQMLDDPEESIKAFELSLGNFGVEGILRARFFNLPESQKIKIKDIRSEHLGKFLYLEGIVRQSSDVRPQVVKARFECPSCGNVISILQVDIKFKEPSRCTCGKRGKFRLLDKELVDAQRIIIEESPDSLEGGEQPKRLSIFLKEDLVEPIMEKKTTPGSKVRVIGAIKEVPIPLKSGAPSTKYDLMMESNFIEPLEETFEELEVNKEEEKKIIELSKNPKVYEKFINSIAPSIYGHSDIKEALVLQLMGGVRKERKDGTWNRGDIHILLVGDPGSSKSTLLSFISKVAPKARYVSGKSASAAGLTGTIVKDEFLKGWALEGGALALANGGFVCLHPDTRVIINNSIKPIKDVFCEDIKKIGYLNAEKIESNQIENSIESFNVDKLQISRQTTNSISRKLYKGKLVHLKFKSGFEIKLTPNHKIIDGNNFEWKESQYFSKNDFVLAPLKLSSHNSQAYFLDIMPENWKIGLEKEDKEFLKEELILRLGSLKEIYKKFNIDRDYLSGGKQLQIKTFKEILNFLGIYDEWKHKTFRFIRNKNGEKLKINSFTPELCYILGFISGDGYVKSAARRTVVNIIQSIKHEAYINKLEECWNTVFQNNVHKSKPFHYTSSINGKIVESDAITLSHSSNLLGQLYFYLRYNNFGNLLTLSDASLKAFFAGVIDSDGCISDKHSVKKGRNYVVKHIDIFLSNNTMDNQNISLALRRFDCYSKLINLKNIQSVQLTGREDVNTFIFSIMKYSVKAQNSILVPIKTRISSISNKLPKGIVAKLCENISSINKSILVKKGIWSTIYNAKKINQQPSRTNLLSIKEKLSDFLSLDNLNLINKLLQRDFFLDQIIEIKEEDYEGYVYDLYVPKLHNFLAGGIIVHNCLDELDKMDENDTSALHEGLEQQQISFSKANIQATLLTRVSALAAANPKLGRFDPYQPIAAQINLPPALINRFDLIFPMRDIPSEELDTKIASHILEMHGNKDEIEPEINAKLMRKYISYTKKKIFPQLTEGAKDEIRNFYVSLRNTGGSKDDVKPIPISARQLEALIRLSEASAKIRLSEKITKEDSRRAIRVLTKCLHDVGLDPETGKIDIDRIATGISTAQRSKIITVRELINDFDKNGVKTIPINDLIKACVENGLEESKAEEILEKMTREGEVFQPKVGFISKI
ncbi:hypothetical protein HYX16_00805 [Candidatus Woesearchaeota archaeon]|nr:hypothetical protein [Candidatus Woesearchaeota archaeon]